MANKMNADLFISIHSNAAKRSNASGAETYFLSLEASDDEARRVAAFENGVVKLEMESMENSRADDLKAILWDMTKTETLKESSNLAEMVQYKLRNITKGEIRGVKQAPFIVLTNATMPAVLIEVGFITNPDEEQKLSSNTFQDKIAKAIYDGIKDFEVIFTTKTVFSMGGSFND
jgi:N-acetylmuramoyl-L-alanine amidase